MGACSHSVDSGDPGGRLLAEVRLAVTTAVPPGADTSPLVTREPYIDSCDGRAATRGWQPATVAIRLATVLPAADLAAQVDGRIGPLGWHRTTSEKGVAGEYFRWEKQVATGTAALTMNSDETPRPDPRHPWDILAVAPAVGRPATGC